MRLAIASCALLCGWSAAPADACTCAQQRPPCEAFWKDSVIFSGRVESITRASGADGGLLVVAFAVTESFRGDVGARAEVETPAGTARCGFPFRPSKEYVVYASAQSSGRWSTTSCSRTRAVERAAADIAYARSLLGANPPSGRVTGRVMLRTRDLARHRDREVPMPGAPVVLAGTDATIRTSSDASGAFAVSGLEPGTYVASVELGPGFSMTTPAPSFELLDARGCAEVAVSVHAGGRVTGRVVDAYGIPVAGLTVDLTVPIGLDRPPGPERLRALTRLDGTFDIIDVPPGRFVIVIDLDHGRRQGASLFYPGAQLRPTRDTFMVAAGEKVRLGDFVLPKTAFFVKVSGVVFDAAGAPAEGARIFLAASDDGGEILNVPAISDSTGRFVLAALGGRDYRIFAERPRPGTRSLDSSDPLPFRASTTARALRLVLRARY